MDIVSLLPQTGSFISTLLAFVVALSVIVAIHEYGHYIVGRWSGIKAEVFSLGFGPVLFARTDRHGTRWQVAALPFGGYVKFLGDDNAASAPTTSQPPPGMAPERLRQTMQGAPLWARTATVAAGPLFNFILSALIFGAVLMVQGRIADPLAVGELRPLPVSQQVTLAPGDQLLRIEGMPVPDRQADGFNALLETLPAQPLLSYEVTRAGRVTDALGPHPMPPLVVRLAPKSAAISAGLEPGDVITAIDGQPVFAFRELRAAVEGSQGRSLDLTVWRGGETVKVDLSPRRVDEPDPEGGFRTEWRIGIAGGLAFDPATETRGPLAALQGGVVQTGAIIQSSLSGLYHMVTGAISSCNMSGPIGIAQASGAMAGQGVESFVWFIAVLSAAVGLLNLFPVPVLDGGHLVFYAYEAVVGRPPSDAALRVMMAVGLSLILGLMVFAVGNDLFCP